MSNSRKPTNSLIITNASDQLLEDPTPLAEFLSNYQLLIEMVTLAKLGRIIVICENDTFATEISKMISGSPQWNHLRVSYSLRDNQFTSLTSDILQSLSSDKDYLELPAEVNSKRFLISPPPSPPPEWNYWDKVEEGPNQKAIHSPGDISHLLWERLGGYESSDIRKLHEDPNNASGSQGPVLHSTEVLFSDANDGVPNIVLDGIQNRGISSTATTKISKTSMPPMSQD